jgi:hypothetical protein
MDISFLSLLFFIIITIVYFIFSPPIGKPRLTLSILEDEQKMSEFYYEHLKGLALYLGFVVVTQFFLNMGFLMTKCGGSIDKNIGAAAIFTFIPWVLIFGIMLAVLIMFPGFKGAFADVIGYYVVSGGANDIFGSILMGTDLNEMIEKSGSDEEKKQLTQAAEAIVKICGNKSILINQINPDNFLNIWNTLKPLMTPGSFVNETIKQKLLDLVVLKDNIGEAFWYVYTAILISSIVYYNLATRGCVKNIDEIKSQRDAYIEKRDEIEKQKELNESTTYVT